MIDEAQAIALRNFQAETDGLPLATAEKFRLFGGYADLVSAAGFALCFGAFWGVVTQLDAVMLIPMMAVVAFAIARRTDLRASPAVGTVTMLVFLLGSISAIPALMETTGTFLRHSRPVIGAGLLIGGVAGAAIFWRAFRFPPTLAAAITPVGLLLVQLATDMAARDATLSTAMQNIVPAALALLIAFSTLVAATWWDLTDIRRETERSQVAFWLHCSAGFLLTRALFSLLTGREVVDGDLILTGVELSQLPWLLAMIVIAAFLSLLLDRRSLLTGVLLPLIGIFGQGRLEAAIGMALAGTGLLFFNYGWIRMRRALLAMLPTRIEAQLPRTSLVLQGQRPTRRARDLWPWKPDPVEPIR